MNGRVLAVAALFAVGCTGSIDGGRLQADVVAPDSETPAPSPQPEPTPTPTPQPMPMPMPSAPCTQVEPGAARVIRLSQVELANTLDVLYGQVAPLDVPRDSRAFGYTTGDQQTVNLPFAEGLQRSLDTRGATVRASWAFATACTASEAAARTCAIDQLRTLGRVAFRRPLTASELTELGEIYDLGRDTTATTTTVARARAGMEYALKALAQSPQLLYRTELGATDGAAPGTTVTLTPFELATALSYTLLAAPPDAALLDAAERGDLATAGGRRVQVNRLIAASPAHFAAQLERFVSEWLLIDFASPNWSKNTTVYPSFSPALVTAIKNETSQQLANWARRPSFETLLTGTEWVVGPRTAALYGVASPGTQPASVQLDAAQRAGILTSPAFLGTHAHTDGSSPVSRGVVVMRNVLCRTLPPPPANVPPLPSSSSMPGRTTRAVVENHLRSGGPSCQGCHALFNPMGYALEAYDGLGRFRTHENGLPVDSTGAIVGLDAADQPVAGPTEFARALSRDVEVQRCFAKQGFRFTTGRMERPLDRCTLERIDARFSASGKDVGGLLAALIEDETFTQRKVPAP